jgi:type II secretory ATPase GspE/PulE/Tfp pilus assembly ATPase PilB-like protein
MRAIVRADPDVILIGDMHDRETSALAVQAVLRGARVISAVPAPSAAEAVVRLLELGVEPYSMSDALLGALGQRLVRRLCLACRVSRPLTHAELNALVHEYCEGTTLDAGQVRAEWSGRFGNELRIYGAHGCEACGGTGYRGRIGLFELLCGGTAMRPLIRQRWPAHELTSAAVRQGMRTIKQDGIEKALAGVCDLLEVRAALA